MPATKIATTTKAKEHKLIFGLGWMENGKFYRGYGCEFCGKFFSGNRREAEESAKGDLCLGGNYAR